METRLTLRARRRMKERLGVKSYKKAEILSEKAWAKGMPIQEEPYLCQIHLYGENWFDENKKVLLFRNSIYVFGQDGRLITVFNGPVVFRKKSRRKWHEDFEDDDGG